jgi:hypothetical protein
MKTNQFEIGKTYFSMTRSGKVRTFKVTNILRRKSTGERVFVVASYDGEPERRYPIKTLKNGEEVVQFDDRFATVIDTTVFTGFKNVTEDDL